MRSRVLGALIPVAMAALLGSTAALAAGNACKADLNGDAVVNFSDLAIVKSVFFQTCPRFEDRGKTVLDHQTNLEWEKKTADDGIHSWGKLYTWSTGGNIPDGTAFTVFLAGLNAGACVSTSDGSTESNQTDCSFAGHGDWRMPKLSELKTIVDCSFNPLKTIVDPCIDPIFGPTKPAFYWSSSSYADSATFAWALEFGQAGNFKLGKLGGFYVRAVRGGL